MGESAIAENYDITSYHIVLLKSSFILQFPQFFFDRRNADARTFRQDLHVPLAERMVCPVHFGWYLV